MINSILNFGYELYIFIAVEALIIIIYILFYKYSRKHGGVFDRRVKERRTYSIHGSDRRFTELGFREAFAVRVSTGDMNNNRRERQRRFVADRRSVC
jgi:hypothetical protein